MSRVGFSLKKKDLIDLIKINDNDIGALISKGCSHNETQLLEFHVDDSDFFAKW